MMSEHVITLTCPHCGRATSATMPGNACLAIATCEACGKRIVPKPGDCCVVCSYSSERCPVSVKEN